VVVCFSDDQLECFDFNNYPAFAVYTGEQFRKRPAREGGGGGGGGGERPAGGGGGAGGATLNAEGRGGPQMGRHAEAGAWFPNNKEMAEKIMVGLVRRNFDPAFCMDMPKPDRGIAGGVIKTAEEITEWNLPIVPIMMNLYFCPQPTAYRCYELGKAVREIIEEDKSDLRVVVAGSGGLWHTPARKNAWLNEEFDRRILDLLKVGDARGMAEYFESYEIPDDDASQEYLTVGPQNTGMEMAGKGPQYGSRETCAWIAAAGCSDGSATTIVDYIPTYASPVGNAFAYCDNP
jgi:protocatechuate 4,5-dioxygenase beta chain